jgi:hypothetical protein
MTTKWMLRVQVVAEIERLTKSQGTNAHWWGAGFNLVVGYLNRGPRFYPRITITREGWLCRGGVKERRGRLVSLGWRGLQG